MGRPAAIRQDDLTRIFKAAKIAGVSIRVEVERGGKVVIIPVEPGPVPVPNPWDED